MSEGRIFRRPFPGTQPAYLHPPYASSPGRAPTRPLVLLPHSLTELTGPIFGADDVAGGDMDLTRGHQAEPIGERIVVSGRVLDENRRPLPGMLVELWQANAAGRYRHGNDNHDAPLDPNFTGCGRMLTGADGGYRFLTIKPGAYPWRNHYNAWRPAHLHFSVFGPALPMRLVTQMYFPGDPLLAFDPIYNSVPDPVARARLVSDLDWELTTPEFALGYRFDIVLRGYEGTPFETPVGTRESR